jgi:FixJ family two-component response regulator
MSDLVYIVDDDEAVRIGLRRQLESAGYDVKIFASADDFLANKLEDKCSCLILDVKMPGLSGPDLHRRLVEEKSLLPVIFLSGHADVPGSVEAMKRGAVDILLKPADDATLLRTVAAALEKSRASRLRAQEISEAKERVERLTPRELDVFRRVIAGSMNKHIAHDLGIVEQTVKFHRGSVMTKLEAKSVADLIRIASIAGIEPEKSDSESPSAGV